MPDPKTEELRLEQIERERHGAGSRRERGREPETDQHERRADRAGYLREKLEERAEAEDAAAREG